MAGKTVWRVQVTLVRDTGKHRTPMFASDIWRPYKNRADAFAAYQRALRAAERGNR